MIQYMIIFFISKYLKIIMTNSSEFNYSFLYNIELTRIFLIKTDILIKNNKFLYMITNEI